MEVLVPSQECEQSCICVVGSGPIKLVYPHPTFYWSACIKRGMWAVMYLCGRVWTHKTSLSQTHFLLKCLYQVRNVTGHVFVCWDFLLYFLFFILSTIMIKLTSLNSVGQYSCFESCQFRPRSIFFLSWRLNKSAGNIRCLRYYCDNVSISYVVVDAVDYK